MQARSLVKTFGAFRALDQLDLTVQNGEVHGFLGPNGAGKSTTIRALLGQLRLDSGTADVFGLHPWKDSVEIHARLAYVPGDTSLWPGLSGGECIDVLGRFQGSMNAKRRDELIERFELEPTKKARTYSKGNRQKVALIAALSCDAELYILDEPTSGLDPLMEAIFQQVIEELNHEGRTVLLSSHILSEVEALCDRITIIRGGRTVSAGTLEELRSGTLTRIEAVAPHRASGLHNLPGVTELEFDHRARGVRTKLMATHAAMPEAVRLISETSPSDLVVNPPSLEQLFLEHYQESQTESSTATEEKL
ncbi:MAG: ABC transporter ATP-binding protein [Ancrocorticia sp.]|uniref:ABC transporter ATP-binding protein n=1 Tax=Ancrocorticia sp. TaxID=2593684 RepID=UPI003F93F634